MKKILLIIISIFLLLTNEAGLKAFCQEDASWKEIRRIERAMIVKGNFEDAIDELNKMLVTFPRDSRIYIALSVAYYGLMEYTEAYGYLKKAEEMGVSRESKEMFSYIKGAIDENRDILENIEEANNILKSKREAAADDLKKIMEYGHLGMLGRIMKKEYYYPAIAMPHVIWLKRNTKDMEELHKLSADIYYSAMYYSEAIEDYKKAIEEDPENPELYKTLADCQVAIGDFDNAAEYYQKAIEHYEKQGKLSEAAKLKKIKQALPKKYKDVAELIRMRRFSEAEEICRKRISLNPADYVAITQLGQVYWEKQNRRAAIRLFRKAVKIMPDYPIAHLLLGKAYVFEKKPEKGLAELAVFEEKMELLPEMDEETRDFYVERLHYVCYIFSTLKRYDDVIERCEKIIKLRPDDQKAHYNLAVCYYVSKHNRSRAYNELQKIIEIDPHTRTADMAKYFIDYMRKNPDSRIMADFSFIYEN